MTTHAPAAPDRAGGTPPAADPAPIMQLASGFMAAKHLFAASELGLFEALAGSPASLDALAARTGLTRRAARISADAMVALGLLTCQDGIYRNGKAASAFLAGPGPADLRPFLRFWDKISYPAWSGLADALAKGPAQQIVELDPELQEVASAGIEAILAAPARALAQTVDFSTRARLLDVGGGTGSWSLAIVGEHPHMRATVVELPAVAEIARERITAAGAQQRVAVIAADATAEPLPPAHDICLLANLIHYFSPQENQQLLERVRTAVEPGAGLLIADFLTDPTHTQPLIAALMAGEFAVHVAHGDVYSAEETRAWLKATGWRFTEHRPLSGPVSLVAAEAA